ncbi:hypothetical protein [Methanosarcina horonobensis]|nr:hypothetical protein [Methanosarcina horonobensis]
MASKFRLDTEEMGKKSGETQKRLKKRSSFGKLSQTENQIP